jgi:3-dehydroquinate dehydratase type I
MSKVRHDICVSIGNIGFEEIKELLPKLSVAEVRIDLLSLNEEEIKQCFALHKNLIATYRPKSNEYDLMKNILNQAIEWGAAMVDVDIDTPAEFISEIAVQAKQHNCKLIVSYHNFDCTPTLSTLKNLIEKTKLHHADYTKIACMANSPSDCSRILSLYEKHSNLIAFCMGQVGTVTRIASPLLGAPFSYASLQGNQTAPGQLDYINMNNLLNIINPID